MGCVALAPQGHLRPDGLCCSSSPERVQVDILEHSVPSVSTLEGSGTVRHVFMNRNIIRFGTVGLPKVPPRVFSPNLLDSRTKEHIERTVAFETGRLGVPTFLVSTDHSCEFVVIIICCRYCKSL